MTDTNIAEFEDNEVVIDYENQKNPCYGMRFLEDRVIVTLDNKNIKEYHRVDFPHYIDFNNVSQISDMISLVKTQGIKGLADTLNLPKS